MLNNVPALAPLNGGWGFRRAPSGTGSNFGRKEYGGDPGLHLVVPDKNRVLYLWKRCVALYGNHNSMVFSGYGQVVPPRM